MSCRTEGISLYYSTGSSAQLFPPRGHKKPIVAEKSIQDPRNWSMAVQVARLSFPNGVRMRRRQSTGNVTQSKMLPEHIHIIIINQWGIIFNKEIPFKPHYYGTWKRENSISSSLNLKAFLQIFWALWCWLFYLSCIWFSDAD